MTQTLTTLDGKPLPSSLSAFHMTQGFEPGPHYQRRILLYGRPGHGKTTFLRSIPRCLILDFEDGSRDAPLLPSSLRFGPYESNGRLITPHISEYEKLLLEIIELGKHNNRPFDVVAIDTIDAYADHLSVDICIQKKIVSLGQFGKSGAGYHLRWSRIAQLLDQLPTAGYGWVVAGHLTTRLISVGDSEQWVTEPKISGSVRDPLQQKAQYGFIVIKRPCAILQPVLNPSTKTPELKEDGTPRMFDTGRVEERYFLQTKTITGSKDDTPLKARIPLPVEMAITETDGYTVYADAYNSAVSKVKENI